MRFIPWSESASATQQDRLRPKEVPFCGKEMQSDNRTVTKIELATQQETKEQFNDQQKPESSGQRHHSPGVDGKSLEA